MFILCQFGQQLSDQFASFEHTIFECNWYLFPLDVVHLYKTVMMVSQEPVELKGFANVYCTLETFKNVISS